MVVPLFNEERAIASFLNELALQQAIDFEVILSDGGSSDGTLAELSRLVPSLPFPVKVVTGSKGRGAQLNRGAAEARSGMLLFLHADSAFGDPLSFRKGVDALEQAGRTSPLPVAGHFPLTFAFPGSPPLPYRFYGEKAALDRPGCTHGDQGFLIPLPLFRELGPFDPELPLMEDNVLAERIRRQGRWILLSTPIATSPRRFLAEGLLPRQTLNAILMDLAAVGRLDLIDSLRETYRSQDRTGRLDLSPLLENLRMRIAGLPPAERRDLWRKTGRYVRLNAWQIPFFLDVVMKKAAGGKGGIFLSLHDRLVGRLLDNGVADLAASWLVRLWFRLVLRRCRR
ncbi:glycosyltransferase [Geomonas sp. Red32]|nr:glycosyltransferase [Geomonas sp. Red32]